MPNRHRRTMFDMLIKQEKLLLTKTGSGRVGQSNPRRTRAQRVGGPKPALSYILSEIRNADLT